MTRPRAWIATFPTLITLSIAGCSTTDIAGDGVLTTPHDATDATLATEGSTADASSEFYCGEFGSEQTPTLLAIDVETGSPTWKVCSESMIPMYVAGRAEGATVLVEQNGRGGAELIAVADTGVETWRRPTRANQPGFGGFFASGGTAVVVTDAVEGIEASTGEVRWTHPVADGTPIGTTDDLVIEMSGGPFALSTDVSNASGSGVVIMRAVDSSTGEPRWTRPVDLVDVPMPSQYSPTVGDEVIVIPDDDASATIIEAATGTELRTETGTVEAQEALLFERDLSTFDVAALIDPMTGTRLDPPPGSPVLTMTYRGQTRSGLLLASEPPTGPAATLKLFDTSTGDVRWEIPHVPVIGGSDDYVIVADGPLLQILDAADGAVATEYRAPTDLATFTSAVGGDGIVIVAPQWRGSGPGNAGSGPEQDYVQPDCEGGSPMLDPDISDTRFVVTESVDATFFCVEEDGMSTMIGYVPTTPTPDPREDSTMMSGHGAFHVIALPKGFPREIDAIDDDGNAMLIARGVGADYLVLIEHVPGTPTDGTVFQSPMIGSRTVDLVGPDGGLLARLPVSDLAMANPENSEGAPTYEDFVECAGENGVSIPLPKPGEPPATAEPASADALRDAWASCRDLMAATMRSSGQGGSEFVENFMAQLDCVAAAGFYPSLAQVASDPDASNEAFSACGETTPGRVALVECLTQGGLAVTIDDETTGGPHPPEQAAAAWAGCRDLYITWFIPGPLFVDDRIGPLDCAADMGWILAVMDQRERFAEPVVADVGICYQETG